MKLLQIGPYPPPVGGWSFHIKVFKEYLDKRNYHNLVLNTGPNRKIKSDKYIDVQGPWDYARKVFKYSGKDSTVYIHLNGDSVKGFLLTLLAQLITLCSLRRCALSFHAGIVQVCFQKKFNVQKVLAFIVFFLSNGIMCNSEEVKSKILSFGVNKNKVYPIPCFSMQYLEHEPICTSEESEFIKAHSPIIACYLFFRDDYEPDTIIDALHLVKDKYPNFGCIFIGSKNDSEAYVQKIKKLSMDENFLLVGDKEHDNFLTLFENADISIRAHMKDGMCSSVMEALFLGVPVIACDNGTRPPEVVLFETQNHVDLAEKTVATLSNLEKIKQQLKAVKKRDAIKEELEFLLNI